MIAYLSDPLPGDRFPLHFVNNFELVPALHPTTRILRALSWKVIPKSRRQ